MQQLLWFEVILKASAGLTLLLIPLTAIAVSGMQKPETGFWPRLLGAVVLAIAIGVFLTLQTAMPLMRGNAQGGSIVVVSSASAIKAEPGVAAYGASKAAALHLAKVAAKEGAPDKIKVNAIVPGGVETPMWRQVAMFQDLVRQSGGNEQEAFARLAAGATPLGQYATADDIARQIEMLLVDPAPITGAALVIDGGYTL